MSQLLFEFSGWRAIEIIGSVRVVYHVDRVVGGWRVERHVYIDNRKVVPKQFHPLNITRPDWLPDMEGITTSEDRALAYCQQDWKTLQRVLKEKAQ